MNTRRSSHGARIFAILVLGYVVNAPASAPPYLSDPELADSPIIVVARWNKADFRSHDKYRDGEGAGRVVTKVEAYTTLEVLRTIKGDVGPGGHPLMVGWGIGWSKDGTDISSNSSSYISGDVADITVANLWFLKKEWSWDEKDKTEYLSIDHYRRIQPLILEPFFAALGSPKPELEVPKLLKSKEPAVVLRVLRYACGNQWPWPSDSGSTMRYLNPEKRGKLLRGEAEAVAGVIGNEALKDLRPAAIAVYAELAGEKGKPYLAGLLTNEDPDVRGMAAAILVRGKDSQSIQGIIRAVNGVTDGGMACKIIEAIRGWADIRLAPVLIGFLQNGESAGYAGDDLFIPAIKAREALQEMTGHVFPYDVPASLAAWAKVEGIASFEERKKLLASLIPCDPRPLSVEVVGTNRKAYLRVRNVSNQVVTVAERPSYGDQRHPGGLSGCGFGDDSKIAGKEDFVSLQPGESVQFDVALNDHFLRADPPSRTMTVVYDNNGNQFGVNAWIGCLPVSFGRDWAEERRIGAVAETWPNGNLKVTGQTVNGQRYGEWNFFNEAGDRIEMRDYAGFGGVTTCNPEHPSNKGAGKRQRAE